MTASPPVIVSIWVRRPMRPRGWNNTAPTITFTPALADVNLTCASQITAAPVPVMSDNCTVVNTEMNETYLPLLTGESCANRFRLVRTWKATDACGNTATAQQTVTVNDQIQQAGAADLSAEAFDVLVLALS